MTRPAEQDSGGQMLVDDLLAGMSTGAGATRSLGLVGPGVAGPRVPEHCLECCLEGRAENLATHGCPWLVAASQGRIDGGCLREGRCPKGHRVAAQPSGPNSRGGVLLVVEGARRAGTVDALARGALSQLESASRLLERVGQMAEENAGLAEEVIHNYEQLNLIYELTQQIARVTDVVEIERVVLRRIARLLESDRTSLVAADGAVRTAESAGAASIDAIRSGELAEVMKQAREQKRAIVADVAGAHAMVGLLTRLNQRVDLIVALRTAERGPFKAGDVMLVESILAFGGQIISNAELHEQLRMMSIEVTRALVAAIDKKDRYTSGHSERVGLLSRLTGRELGLGEDELQFIEWSGLLHDVGKIGVPEEILTKPGALLPEEFEIIKQHPRMGWDILKPIASFQNVLDGVLYHHEQPDGKGYPEGLAGDQTPLVARIIHVADVFDALSSTRSYRAAFTVDQACDIIRKDLGTRIDRAAGLAFLKALDRFRNESALEYARLYPPEPETAAPEDVGEGI